ncbi:MAG: RNA-directed DNA polymerase [Pseudomonadales bacterium]
MVVSKTSIEIATKNVVHFSDTDVFPRPFELLALREAEGNFVALLEELDANYDEWFKSYSPQHVRSQAAVGYHGFRAATQIDMLWNTYLLALVIELSAELENERLEPSKNIVFSYRVSIDTSKGTLFDKNYNWQSFNQTAEVLASDASHVLITDIADFYGRIYHHRLENALNKLKPTSPLIQKRIMDLVSKIAGVASYGLPVGGPAARLLSELLLNRVDRLLRADGVNFIRFVDDFRIFAESEEQAYRALVTLSDFLQRNEGLTLNRSKTRILSTREFLSTSTVNVDDSTESSDDAELRDFMKLRLKFDPYSPTADEDYEALVSELKKFDVVGLLMRETRKSRIDERVTRQLLNSIRHLGEPTRNAAIESMLENLSVLYPVFPSVMTLILASFDKLDTAVKLKTLNTVNSLIADGSYITQVPANLAFALRVLAFDKSEETDAVLSKLYQSTTDMMIRRDIIFVMTFRESEWWISNLKDSFPTFTPWEKSAYICASYILDDEGKHWRGSVKETFDPYSSFVREWASMNKQANGKLLLKP